MQDFQEFDLKYCKQFIKAGSIGKQEENELKSSGIILRRWAYQRDSCILGYNF